MFPTEIRADPPRRTFSFRRVLTITLFIAVVLFFGFLGLIFLAGPLEADQAEPASGLGDITPTMNEVVLPTNTPPVAPSAEPGIDPTPLPSALPETPPPSSPPTEAPTSTVAPSPFPTPGPGFETPFGPSSQFLIHIVQANESLQLLATRYDSSVEAIEAINVFTEGASLWEGKQLVIPVGVTNPSGLPRFTVLYLTDASTLEAIGTEFQSDAAQIRFFNALGDGDRVPAGRWLIIPIIGG